MFQLKMLELIAGNHRNSEKLSRHTCKVISDSIWKGRIVPPKTFKFYFGSGDWL